MSVSVSVSVSESESESESVSESESESEVARDAVPAAYERRTRVRALLKPEPGRRKADTAR